MEAEQVAASLQVTSRKDQGQYWADEARPHKFVPVQTFSTAFEESEVGQGNALALSKPYSAPGKAPLDALVRTKFALSGWQAFKACLRREWTLMMRHKFIYIFRTCQARSASLLINSGHAAVRMWRLEPHALHMHLWQRWSASGEG